MDIYYENCEREKYNMSEFPVAIEDVTCFFGKTWDYDLTENKQNNRSRLDRIYRTKKEISPKLSIFADSKAEYENCMHEFERITEKDIFSKTPGKIWVNGYYLTCFIIAENPAEFEEMFYAIENEIKIISEYPFWVKESEHNFNTSNVESKNNKKYGYKYPYRYANGMSNNYIINPHFTDANFKLMIYGPVINPQVIIGGTPYLVNIVLEEGERLEIDSRNETVIKIMQDGTPISVFHNRQKGRYFFAKIPPGRQSIIWTGKFDFDLIVYEERSEPKWNV